MSDTRPTATGRPEARRTTATPLRAGSPYAHAWGRLDELDGRA